MKTIIRRYRRRYAVSLASVFVAVILAVALAWIFMTIWARGGPQPVHPIVIAIPAPQMPAAQMLATGRRA